MSTFQSASLTKKAVYWGTPVPDGYGGKTFDDPVEIACRWVDKTEEIKTPEGDTITSVAQVVVGQDLDVGGYLLLGKLIDLNSDELDPMTTTRAHEILIFQKVADVPGSSFYRKALL